MLETYTLIVDEFDEKLNETLLPFVSKERREKIQRFHFAKDRQMSLLADILLRSLICKHLGLSNNRIEIVTTFYGKPYLKNMDGFHFNISHSGNHNKREKYVACAISDQEVGVDVEIMQDSPGGIEALLSYFHPEERDRIMDRDGIDRQSFFTKIWTMKESYIKLLGVGLNIPLNTFNTLADHNRYRFHHVVENTDAVCSVCSEANSVDKSIVYYASSFTKQVDGILRCA